MGLPRRITSHPLGSSVSGGSFYGGLGRFKTGGCRFFPPSARLELLLRRVRRRLGRHRRGTPSVRSLNSEPKGTLHQPQSLYIDALTPWQTPRGADFGLSRVGPRGSGSKSPVFVGNGGRQASGLTVGGVFTSTDQCVPTLREAAPP